LCELEALALARANDEHGIASQAAIPLGALKLNRALENLHLEESLIKVNPEARFVPGNESGSSDLYFVVVVTLGDDIERPIPLMERHAVYFPAARKQRKLRELEQRGLPQPCGGGVLKFDFRKPTVCGGDSEAFLNGRIHRRFCPFRDVRSLEGYRPLHETQAHDAHVRVVICCPAYCQSNKHQKTAAYAVKRETS
jgi:hypothetical protein